MRLKVGELAKRTGVTVRALHHYDRIGLLRPSARSEGGYRLYDRDDVARLHAIQTLRQLGVALAEMPPLLDGGAPALQAVLVRQIGALDRQIAHSQALRERLGVMERLLAEGRQPGMDDWLASLMAMTTYHQHFSASELQRAAARWSSCEAEWIPLVQALRAAMQRGLPPDAADLQPLVTRWIDLATRWMDGDLELLGRWGTMLREHPELPLPAGMDLALVRYVDDAIAQRQAAVSRRAGPDLQRRLAETRADWYAFVERGRRLMDEGVPPGAPAARELARDWAALWQRTVGDDRALRGRLIAAYETEPLLQAGLPQMAALRRYVEQASGA